MENENTISQQFNQLAGVSDVILTICQKNVKCEQQTRAFASAQFYAKQYMSGAMHATNFSASFFGVNSIV